MKQFWSANLFVFAVSGAALLCGLGLFWGGNREIAHWVWIGGSAPALALLLYDTLRALVRREAGVDMLALISISGAIALDEYLTGAVIAVMLASGRALESFAQRRAGREMSALLAKAPRTANRFENGGFVQILLEQVIQGDRLLVRSGDTVPVDGRLSSALAVLDESMLSGESTPVERREGDALRSGVLNAGAPFEMLATAKADESTFAGIIRLVSAAQSSKAPASRLADRYALWFVPLSLAVAGAAWFLSDDPVRALAVLVVATPCPLILSVPIAIVSGMSICAKRGVLIKGGGALEQLAQARILFFDKTGTLTGGRARLVSIKTSSSVNPNSVLVVAASMDQMSGHVIASAVVDAARERGLSLSLPTAVQEQGGSGLSGILDGKQVAIGSYEFVSARASSPEWAYAFLQEVAEDGGAAVFVALDGEIAGALHLADQIRVETPRALRLLRRAGIKRIVMLTGDNQQIADTIGAAVGVDEVQAEQTPAGKQVAIESGRSLGITMMVGDGVNDAPALAAADVGVSMGVRGAAVSSEAADVVLLVDRLDRLAEALHTARLTRLIALQSVIAGMGMSAVAMLIAAFGYLPPLYGALLQEVIDVAVILNALRALNIAPLRVSRHTLSATQLQTLRDDHLALAPVLEYLTYFTTELSMIAPAQVRQAAVELDVMLQEKLFPHERSDDTDVYPVLAELLGGDDPMAAMSRTHREIFELGRRLKRIIKAIPPDRSPKAETITELQRVLYGLDAILRLHFAQEEEIYQNLE
ncbi:heavy metal translocating P-type ATPase [Yersinia intermedia]|uniref:heavy metal translocating P-type ATPase n=1 Tax=Yersinia intermedia TaxID=631 RepID=UPI00119E51E4|nr:heavy metal translocating P-type ATPase [Yersinia intermedia]MDN0115043.1 heavy metal translocating P-type ATPase [Yersinia intermedia]